MSEDKLLFEISLSKVNDLQVGDLLRSIARANRAHHTNVQFRINGQYECYEADWLKHLTPVDPSELAKLRRENEELKKRVDAAHKILAPQWECDPDIREWLGLQR